MRTVSLLELRQKAKAVLASVQKGQRIILTYRGKPIARLEPFREESADSDDPFYRLNLLATKNGQSINNSQIDALIYGE